jgi:hypothetical protein
MQNYYSLFELVLFIEPFVNLSIDAQKKIA